MLVFAILVPAKEFEKEAEDWSPADRANEPDPDRVKFDEQIFEIFFLVLFLVVFNLYPGVIGFGFFIENDGVFISPVLTDAFFNYLPSLNILILLEIGLGIYLLRRGFWNVGLGIAKIILELAGIRGRYPKRTRPSGIET